jgi:CHASE2 domain-containing sensor protein/class 3 adenylate cyclase
LTAWLSDRSRRRALLFYSAAFLLVTAIVLSARYAGALQELELSAYDAMLRLDPPRRIDERLVLVEETEADLQRFGHPLSDELLATLLDRLLQHGPAAIGMDKYRDISVPPGSAALQDTLRRHKNVFWIFRFGPQGPAAPEPLRGTSQAAFSDFAPDAGGVMRRAVLFMDDGKETYTSLATAMSLEYLKRHGLGLGPADGDPDAVQLGRSRLAALNDNDGGYRGADMGGFQILLDYRANGERIRRYTLSEVMEGKADDLRNRIVVFGTNAESMPDHFYTPYSKGDAGRPISGTELHAQIAGQLVRFALGESRPLRVWPEARQLLYAVFWIALGIATFKARSLALYLVVCVAGVVAIVAASTGALATQALWVPVVAPLAGFALSASSARAVRAALEHGDRVILMSLFSRHVSDDVAEEIWNRREELLSVGRLRPVELTVTILFSDIRGFTPISEKLGPLKLSVWLDEYMNEMSQAIIARGGLIRQFVGDAIMAVFGAPIPRESTDAIAKDAAGAIDAAVAMREVMAKLNDDWAARGQPTAGTRIGVHTGKVIACTIGTAVRLEYALVGDVVNTAARLEGYPAEPGQALPECRILVSGVTRDLIGERVRTEWVGELSLKGKSEKVPVFRVI